VKNRLKFSKICERQETLSVTLKIWILQESGFKELKFVLFASLFLGLHILFYTIFGQFSDFSLEHSEAMNEPHKMFK
jgi:hypothetical protein